MARIEELFVVVLYSLAIFYVSAEPKQDAQDGSGKVNGLNTTGKTIIINKTINIYNHCTGSGCKRTSESTSGSSTAHNSIDNSNENSDEDSSEETFSGSELLRIGCYRDKGKRQLGLAHWTFPANSPAVCVAACKQAGYKYAGPEASNHCFCGNIIPPEKIADSNCNMKCNGAPEVNCGGWWALEIFDTKLEQKQHVVRVGCYRDKGVRTLGITHWVFSRNSPAVCIAACRQKAYKYAGPEARVWCFCGNLLPPERIDDSSCNMNCNGAEHIKCGGIWALDVHETGLYSKIF